MHSLRPLNAHTFCPPPDVGDRSQSERDRHQIEDGAHATDRLKLMADDSAEDRITHRAYLAELLVAEVDDREGRRRERRIAEARFPLSYVGASASIGDAPENQLIRAQRTRLGLSDGWLAQPSNS